MDYIFSKYDKGVIEDLQNLIDQGEGGLFSGFSSIEENIEQIKFHENVFSQIKPKHVLETGTHKGAYDYLIKVNVPEVKIDTFDINLESHKCVDYLNNYFNERYIVFHHGNSIDRLLNYREGIDPSFDPNVKFDLAWVDGGHSLEAAYYDLYNCARLGIENITIDDLNLTDVEFAFKWFLGEKFVFGEEIFQYEIVEQSSHERKIAWIKAKKYKCNKFLLEK
jgi:hypothetical protein